MPRAPRPIFTERWQAGAARSVETAMPATVRIYRNDGAPVYDPATNTYVTPTVDVYGPGKSRVQPLRSSKYEIRPLDNGYVQTVLVSIPISAAQGVDFRVADKVQVLVAVLNDSITRYQYIVNEIIDSSNPFERTLLCTVDLETRVAA